MTKDNLRKHLYIIGFMAAGKSTVSAILAKDLGLPLVELDNLIEEDIGMPIKNFFIEYGESAFRDLESDTLVRVSQEPPAIISCGGGLPLRSKNRRIMRSSGKTIFLTAGPDTILKRLKQDPGRPLSDNKSSSEIIKLMEEREPSYLEAADVRFETDGIAPSSIASEIILFLHRSHLL